MGSRDRPAADQIARLLLRQPELSPDAMRRQHYIKSMTSYGNHRIWQDVYHVPSEIGVLYVKFTADAVTEFLLLSFKERDDG